MYVSSGIEAPIPDSMRRRALLQTMKFTRVSLSNSRNLGPESIVVDNLVVAT